MNEKLTEISSRFNVVNEYDKYLTNINQSTVVKVHSVNTLIRYLDRPGLLHYVNILNLKFPNDLQQLQTELNVLKTGVKYDTFYDKYKDILPTEIIEVLYFDTQKFARYVYFNFIVYWLFDKQFGKDFPNIVENMAYFIIGPDNLIGTNIANLYKRYDYLLSTELGEREYKLELLARLTEMEQSLLELSNTTFTYIDIIDDYSICLLQTDIKGNYLDFLYTTVEYVQENLEYVYNRFKINNSIIFTCNTHSVLTLFKNNFILGFFDFNDRAKELFNTTLYENVYENLYSYYNMNDYQLLNLFEDLADYSLQEQSLKNVLIMYNAIKKSNYFAYK